MLLTVHTLTGGLIALAVKDPALAAPLAFTSHFVLDSTPHFGIDGLDFKTKKGKVVGITDCVGAFITWLMLVSIFPAQWFLISVGVFFACLPDLLYIPDIFFNFIPSKKLLRFHSRIQWSQTPMGTITDVFWATAVIFMISRFR
jgi:hypothetical protein